MFRVAERWVEQFADLTLSTVVRVVTDCVAGDLDPDPGEVYRATLADLSDHRQPKAGG